MKLLLSAMTLAVACATFTAAAPADAASGDNLTISQNCYGDSCFDTTFDTTAYDDGDDMLAEATLVDVATGAEVPDFSDVGGMSVSDALPAGTYLLTLRETFLAHWDCSIYYKDGCHWLSGWSDSYQWKFGYAGSGTLTVPQWTAPYTKVVGSFSWHNYVDYRTRGKVGDMMLEAGPPGYSLAPKHRTGRRTVLIQVASRPSGPWKTIHKGKTRANGKFDFRFTYRTRVRHFWRFYAPAQHGQPAGIRRFSGAA